MSRRNAYSALVAELYEHATDGGTSSFTRLKCPACLDRTGKYDKHGALSVSNTTGWYKCWKCGIGGRIDTGLSADLVREVVDTSPDYIDPPDRYLRLSSEEWDSFALTRYVGYLKTRGVGKTVAESAHIGVFTHSSRIVFPIMPPYSTRKWMGYVARSIIGQEPKYLNSKGLKRKGMFYNESALYAKVDTPLIVVEGVFDALTLWPHAVACLGKPTTTQVDMLSECKRPVVMCLDGDAWEESRAVATILFMEGVTSGFLRLPPLQDPNSIGRIPILSSLDASLAMGMAGVTI